MLKSALDYLGGGPFAGDHGQNGSAAPSSRGDSDPLVGSIVDVGGTKVTVRRRIGEGGFAFVYEASDLDDSSKRYALKRLLAVDSEKREQIVREISILKSFSRHDHIVRFFTAASNTKSGREEFLVLMEFCPYVLSDVLSNRREPFPPSSVAKVFVQLVDSVSALHQSDPPIVHRDLKLENLLVDASKKRLKLCDFGSATTETFRPTVDWTMNQRTHLEEEMARHTTPMYRAPEMLDTWSNHPVDTSADVWALGCLLYTLCFHRHPFEDSAKLAIVNGNFKIPPDDGSKHFMFHDLIRQMLNVDPTCRPSCVQVLEHLTSIALSHGIDPTADVDFELDSAVRHPPPSPPPVEAAAAADSTPPPPSPQQHQAQGGIMSSLRGGAGSLMTRLKDKSQSVMQTVQQTVSTTKELDLHCITERAAAMSFPADGLESAFRNHIDDVSATIESRHPGRYLVVNLSERSYSEAKFPTGKVFVAGWKTTGPTPLAVVLRTLSRCLEYLQQDEHHVIVAHCLDGKSNTAVLSCGLLMAVGFVNSVEDALKFFALKRCEAVLRRHHRTTLGYLESVFVTSPAASIESRAIAIKSIVLEPLPLFTKNQDGCRPFVEVTSGPSLDRTATIPHSVEYGVLKAFSTYDEEATIRGGGAAKAEGDVGLAVFHARQTLGSFLSSSKFESLLVCRLYFHTAFVPAKASCLRFKMKDLDGVAPDDQRFPHGFKVVVNFHQDKSSAASRKVEVLSPMVKCSLGLVFASQAEHENNSDMMKGGGADVERSEEVPVAPPRSSSSRSKIEEEEERAPPRPSSDAFLLDFGNVESNARPSTPTPTPSDSIADLISIQDEAPKGVLPPTPKISQSASSNDLLLGNFGSPPLAPTAAATSGSINDLLLGDLPDFKPPAANVLLNPTPPQPKMSTADDLVNDLLQGLNVNAANSSGSSTPTAASSKANYNSAYFQPATTRTEPSSSGGVGRRVTEDTFNDLLGGFASSSSAGVNEPKTIGEMKKKEEMRHMSEHEAKVFKWKDGKARNLRALLCSLDTILWEGPRWTKCGMHQLVTQSDVKKMYRKACLAVHPDKQVGTENEELSKLIFMELNDAWSEFEKS